MTPATENLCTALRGWISLSHLGADREIRSGIMMEIYGAMINDYHLYQIVMEIINSNIVIKNDYH